MPLPLRVMGSLYSPGCACFTSGLFLTPFFFPAVLLAQPAEVNQTAADTATAGGEKADTEKSGEDANPKIERIALVE